MQNYNLESFLFPSVHRGMNIPATVAPFHVFLEGEVRSSFTSMLNSSAPTSGSLLISQERPHMPTLDWRAEWSCVHLL